MATTETTPMSTETLLRKVDESAAVSAQFFRRHAEEILTIARVMAERFQAGGRLFVMGNGGSACDAEHLVVEFMHPIFEKRQSLPAISLVSNSSMLTAISNDTDFSRVFSDQLKQMASPCDIALALSTSGMSPNLVRAMTEARAMGLLTIAFTGKDGGRLSSLVDHNLCVDSFSIHRIQEAHVILLHTVWDMIHIALGNEDII